MNYWIWFSQIEDLGPVQKKKSLDVYGTPEKIYNVSAEELSKIGGIREKAIINICKSKDVELISRYEKYIKINGIKIINILDKEYPKKLKDIYDPPITLFSKGNYELLNLLSLAIIGCREATEYGLKIAYDFAYQLAALNINVVSGLAKGVDNYSHLGALDANGNTLAVLGSGIDVIYPYENINTYKRILNNGLMISEYIVGTKTQKRNFIARNRIISGISDGVIVIEAKNKSGTMITTDFALEQGKNVYAVPGNINSENSKGTNELIKQGAKAITAIADVLEDFI